MLQIPEPLNSCTFAARLPASEVGLPLPLSAFKGQMGCIYLFEDILSPGNAAAQPCSHWLHQTGAGPMPPGDCTDSRHGDQHVARFPGDLHAKRVYVSGVRQH